MSNLNRADDTNPSPSVNKKNDCWYESVKNDEDVKIISEDGSSVEINLDDGITPEAIADKMRCLVNDLLAPEFTVYLADSANEDNSVTDNAATAVTNEAKARQGEIKNDNIVLAVESMLACADITHLSKLALDASSFLDAND